MFREAGITAIVGTDLIDNMREQKSSNQIIERTIRFFTFTFGF